MQKMCILLVGMKPEYLSRMKKALSLAGLENSLLLEALTGARAMELCSEQYPGIILSSYDLPDMSGLELLEKLGEYKFKTHMKFLLLADPGELDQDLVQQAGRLGLDDLVLKPFEDRELASRLSLRLHPGSHVSDCQLHFCRTTLRAELGCWEYNQLTRNFFFSQSVYSILGYSRGNEPPGYDFLKNHFSSRDVVRLRKKLNSLQPGEDFSIELDCRRRDGKERCIRILGRIPSLEQENQVTGIFQDVTLQKRVENRLEELSEQTSLQAAALEQSGEGIVITNQKFGVLYVNPFFDQTSGFKASELIHHLKKRMPDWNSYELLLEEEDIKGAFWRTELSLKDKKGDMRQVEVTVSPVRDNRKNVIVNYVLLVRDITERLDLEKQLQLSQKMEALGTLAGGIAHDFNNSLMGIQGFTELALSRLPDEARAREYLQSSLQTLHRAKEMVQQILTFSGHREITLSFLDSAEVLRETLNLMQVTMPANIELKTDIHSNLPPVHADSTRLHQLITNLCTNAVQAMPEGGMLKIGLYGKSLDWKSRETTEGLAEGSYLVLEVEDTGQGMEEDVMGRIFDPFFTTKARNEGTGLGLSVVHGILDELGGTVKVKSKPAKGSLFRVFIPAAGSKPLSHAGGGAKPGIATGNEKARILFVDDQEDIVSWGVQALEDLGYRVHGSSDSEQAWADFQKSPDSFDLLVTDLRMPGLSGSELISRVKRIRPGLSIVLCTGHRDKIVSDLEKKADAVLYKPFSIADLSAQVDSLLRKKDFS